MIKFSGRIKGNMLRLISGKNLFLFKVLLRKIHKKSIERASGVLNLVVTINPPNIGMTLESRLVKPNFIPNL